MVNGYENFDNSEMNFRSDTLIQERIGLVSTHMYKQFLDYQNATMNTNRIFKEIVQDMNSIVESLKKSFSSRGVSVQNNIYYECDPSKTIAIINILWQTISLTTRCNFEPQALFREGKQRAIYSRIMAVRGNCNELIRGIEDKNELMNCLLANEIASLYIPADDMQNAVFTIRHLGNKEFYLNSQDVAKEFILKVIEIVCGGGSYHKEEAMPNFSN